MQAKTYITKFKAIQQALIDYFDNGSDEEFDELVKTIIANKISENRNELKSLLQLMRSIFDNHHRQSDFINKIEKILLNILSNIKQNFEPKELVNLFYYNRIILLFLIEQKVLTIEDLPQKPHFLAYFYPEIEETPKEDQKEQYFKEFDTYGIEYDKEQFKQSRKIGENDSYISKLIREDSVEEFIAYINRYNISLTSHIPISLFETHEYLINKKCNLIEYAAFFGSIQIFNYLRFNNVELEQSLWFYTIYGNNHEMIHILEENNVGDEPKEKEKDKFDGQQHQYYLQNRGIIVEKMKKLLFLVRCLSESIKCHHNEIAEYIRNKILELTQISINDIKYIDNFIIKQCRIQENYRNIISEDEFNVFGSAIFKANDYQDIEDSQNIDGKIADSIFSSFNFYCFPTEIDKLKWLIFFCEYDYNYLVELFINEKKIDVNTEIVLKNRY